ncbi:MAG TPA: hypothetical protein VNU71_13280 [Burkholderiaceae bacterium]|nr:hypothetical protein [Burkholderiaceae bacterium]
MNVQPVVEKVTPQKAEAWLNQNKTNRKLREGVAEKYADDMTNSRWTQCTAPIAFYKDGDLADGQHRLFAVSLSGVPQTFIVLRDLDRKDGLNIDTGLSRDLVDAGRISGTDTDLSRALISAARAIAEGDAQRSATSNAAKLAIVEEHRAAAQWAATNVRRVRYLSNASVLGAVGRAWYVETDHAKLKRFCDVLGDGFSAGDSESAAIALRNYLIARTSSASTAACWRDTFLKAMNAIAYFMAGKKLTVIKGVTDEAYPLKGKGRKRGR